MLSIEELTQEDKAKLFDKILDIVWQYLSKKEPKQKQERKSINELGLLENQAYIQKYWLDLIKDFINYWGEKSVNWRSERRHKEKVFDIEKRLDKFLWNKKTNFWKIQLVRYDTVYEFDKWMRLGKQEEMKKELGDEKYIQMKNEWKNSSLYV